MKRLAFAAAVGAALFSASVGMAQPKGGPGGQRGPMPRMKDGSSPSLDQKLDRLEAQLKDLEAELSKLQPDRRPEPKSESRRGGEGRGFGGFPGTGPMGGGFGRGSGPGGAGFGGRGGPGGSADFERRLERIIDDLEQLKKDMSRPGQRGGGGR